MVVLSDLSDGEWRVLAPLVPAAKPGGRPRSVDMRDILNGIFYILRGGCAWRMMPHDLPKWKTVYDYFRYAGLKGFWLPEGHELTPEQLAMLRGHRSFKVLPKRWVVERTLAWVCRYRRHSKDYEYLPESSEALIYAAMIRLMVTGLAKSKV